MSWYGGKGNMVNEILPYFPVHTTYVEVYGGGASLLFAKPPSPVEVYNDVNTDLVNFFRVLRDKDKYVALQNMLELTPYSRYEWEQSYDYKDAHDDVTRAYKFFIRVRNSFSAGQRGWSFSIDTTNRGMSGSVSKYLSVISRLPQVHSRLMVVQIECKPALELIPLYDRGTTFFYLDPPYVHETRVATNAYEYEMTDYDHEEMLRLVTNTKGMVMISGYNNHLYDKWLQDWNKVEFSARCVASLTSKDDGEERGYRTECLWMNYRISDAPLFEYAGSLLQ
jgi:DNA adenine methylase